MLPSMSEVTEANELVKLRQCVFNMTLEEVVQNESGEVGAMVLHWTSWTTQFIILLDNRSGKQSCVLYL